MTLDNFLKFLDLFRKLYSVCFHLWKACKKLNLYIKPLDLAHSLKSSLSNFICYITILVYLFMLNFMGNHLSQEYSYISEKFTAVTSAQIAFEMLSFQYKNIPNQLEAYFDSCGNHAVLNYTITPVFPQKAHLFVNLRLVLHKQGLVGYQRAPSCGLWWGGCGLFV